MTQTTARRISAATLAAHPSHAAAGRPDDACRVCWHVGARRITEDNARRLPWLDERPTATPLRPAVPVVFGRPRVTRPFRLPYPVALDV